MRRPARTLLAAPALACALAATLTGCSGEEAPVEERFCDRITDADQQPLAIDASILQDKARLKAAIDAVGRSPLVSIPDADVPPAVQPKVTQLRTGFTSVRDQLVAADYDVSKLNLSDALALQGAATELNAYVRSQCGVDLLATTSTTATTASAPAPSTP